MTVIPTYTLMPQEDLDTLAALIDRHGVQQTLGGVADYITQRCYGDAKFSLMLGALFALAEKVETPK